MKKIIVFLTIVFFYNTSNGQDYRIGVHPGTELLHIVNYYAKVYTPAVPKSAYLSDVRRHFDPYKNHPAVIFASNLKFNDFVDLGWCIEFPTVKVSEPKTFGYQQKFHSYDTLITYLRLSAQFAKESNFYAFYQNNKARYDTWSTQFEQALKKDNPLQKLQDFYQDTIAKIPYFSLSPMGVVLRANIQSEIINPKYGNLAPIIIPYDLRYVDNKKSAENEEPSFSFNHTISNNIWHEMSHVYWEELARPYKQDIMQLTYEDSLTRQFQPLSDKGLNFYFFFHEIIADGVAVYLKKVYDGTDAAEAHLKINDQAGTPLFREMVTLMEQQYWKNRKEKHFQSFIPDIIKMMKQKELQTSKP